MASGHGPKRPRYDRQTPRAEHVVAPRIVSGRFRGQTLRTPGGGTHPMGSREKLALFNMVNVESARVLDAYAGSGALGIEALSRGAREVVFVESWSPAIHAIQHNLAHLGLTASDRTDQPDSATTRILPLRVGDFSSCVQHAPTATEFAVYREYFDVIFADPPYDRIDLAEVRSLAPLLAPDGTLALSSPADYVVSGDGDDAPSAGHSAGLSDGVIPLPGLRVSSTHTYARARITLYRKSSRSQA